MKNAGNKSLFPHRTGTLTMEHQDFTASMIRNILNENSDDNNEGNDIYGDDDNTLVVGMENTPNEKIWSSFQQDIFDFGVNNSRKNLIIQAVAGSGKTSTLFELAKRLKGSIVFLAFNKDIAQYAKEKMRGFPNIDCRTFHSLGMQLIQKTTGFYSDVDSGKLTMYFNTLNEFDRKYYRGEFYPKFIARRVVKQIRQLGMLSYEVDDIREFLQSTPGIFSSDARKRAEETEWVYKNVISFPMWLRELDKLPLRPKKHEKTGKKIQTYRTVIDFDDMVRMPCIHKLVLSVPLKESTALIDESQDMNPYQIDLVQQLYKLDIRTICCGDFLQAIYAFRGAFADSMQRMKATVNAHELPLSITYRCRQEIVDFVNKMIPESKMIAHKEGGEVFSIDKKQIVDNVIENDVRMIIGARNKSLLECWIMLASKKVSSSLKGSGIVEEIRDLLEEIKPIDIENLCEVLRQWTDESLETNDDGEVICKIDRQKLELMKGIPDLIDQLEIKSLRQLQNVLNDMEQDALRELHTVHSSKGLESRSVIVLGDWFPTEQSGNMEYVAYTRAEDQLIIVSDWMKEEKATEI